MRSFVLIKCVEATLSMVVDLWPVIQQGGSSHGDSYALFSPSCVPDTYFSPFSFPDIHSHLTIVDPVAVVHQSRRGCRLMMAIVRHRINAHPRRSLVEFESVTDLGFSGQKFPSRFDITLLMIDFLQIIQHQHGI